MVSVTKLKRSTNPKKKYMVTFHWKDAKGKARKKTVHFGASGMEDYTIHKDLDRKKRYIARHSAISNFDKYMSAASLSRYVLWNLPDLDSSWEFYLSKFNLQEYSE